MPVAVDHSQLRPISPFFTDSFVFRIHADEDCHRFDCVLDNLAHFFNCKSLIDYNDKKGLKDDLDHVFSILEKLNEAIAEESWFVIEELIEELEAEAGYIDPFEDYDEEDF